MKIKRFFENEVQGPNGTVDLSNDISTSRVEEIIKEMSSSIDNFDKNHTQLKKFEEELKKYTNKSSSKNDQIDDSIIELQMVNKSLEQDILSRMDIIIEKLKNYIKEGRNYIYTK